MVTQLVDEPVDPSTSQRNRKINAITNMYLKRLISSISIKHQLQCMSYWYKIVYRREDVIKKNQLKHCSN